ncbi:MAG: hypothetical protein EP297_04355 [Gammaproteobacteria bacterium]|nr:MAG: hypothetical protein EP297_04355 [Gammaproteobacteria bacterium]
MRALAAWVIAKRSNALVATSAFAVMGLLFPPVIVFSFAVLGLITMRRGAHEGLFILFGAAMFMLLMVLMVGQSLWIDFLVITSLWGVAWILALIYRKMAAPAWILYAAGLMGMLAVTGFHLVAGDPSEYWLEFLNNVLRPVFEEANVARSSAELDDLFVRMSQVLTGSIAALVCVIMIISLFLARWWQALLYNPGGFRKEFHALRLGRVAALIMLGLIAASLIGKFAVATDAATVAWVLFFFQGLAILHALVAQFGLNVGWLIVAYFLVPYISPALSGLGFIDTWFDFRHRLPKLLNKH